MYRLMKGFFMNMLKYISFILILLILVQISRKINFTYFINFHQIPDPFEVVFVLMQEFINPTFVQGVAISLGRVYAGFLVAAVISIVVAIIVHTNALYLGRFIHFFLEMIRPIPNVAWVPFSIILFNSLEMSVGFITFISAFFPIFINTLHGMQRVSLEYKRIAQILGVTRKAFIYYITLPASLPFIFTGLILGMSGAWLGLIVAEMINGRSGIGYYTWVNYTLVNLNGVAVGMLTIGLLGAASTWLLKKVGNKLIYWK